VDVDQFRLGDVEVSLIEVVDAKSRLEIPRQKTFKAHCTESTKHNNNIDGDAITMPADRLLTNVLRAYQDPPDPEQNDRILSSTTSLLTTLSNPLNVTLLTSHLLTAPAIWNQVDRLRTCLRIISIFNTAAITVHKNQVEGHQKPYDAYQPRQGGGISCDDWARAVVKGLDDRTPRWQHMLVIGGVLLGMEGQENYEQPLKMPW
jgi:hypothetical protein